jgi:O-antigen ligase
MKRAVLGLLCAGAVVACAPGDDADRPRVLGLGVDVSNMDRSVDPRDDFFRFVNGAWLERVEIPADRARWSSFDELREAAEQHVLAIVQEAAASGGPEGSDLQKVGDLYERLVVLFTDWKGYLVDLVARPLLIVLAALLVAAAVAQARKAEPFVAALAVGACVLALIMFGFIIAAELPRLSALASSRARGFYMEMGTHANQLGRVFVTAYALLLFTWWETKHAAGRTALFVALGVLGVGITLTFSRNAYLGALLVSALFVMWKFNAKKFALGLGATALAVAFLPHAVYRRISHGFDTGSADAVSAGRIEGIWQPLLPDALDSPIFGEGLNSIMWSEAIHHGAMEFVGHPHNAYLQAILDMGLVGLALLLAYYLHAWKGFRALGSNADLTPTMRGFCQGGCAALLAFAVACMTGGSLRPEPENALLWVAIGIMYGLLARRPAS